VAYLGGDPPPGRMGEDHEIVLVVAADIASARAAARKKWSGTTRAHVDAIRPVSAVDGFRILLEATSDVFEDEIDTTFEP